MAADHEDNKGGWSCAFTSGRSSCSTACDDKIGRQTTTDDGRHNVGKGQQGNRPHNDGDGRNNNGDGRHVNRRHDDGKGQHPNPQLFKVLKHLIYV